MARSDRRPTTARRDDSVTERLTRLEGAVENLGQEFERVGTALDSIERSLNEGHKTNWSVVIAGVLLVLALYAAAISPLKADLERQAKVDAAHEVWDQKAHDEADIVKDRQIDVISRLKALELINAELRNTVPSMDRRVALLELKAGLIGK